jgi:hypothetical protein
MHRRGLRFVPTTLFLLLTASLVGAITQEEFDQTVDFTISISEIVQAVEEGTVNELLGERVVLLDGNVGSINIVDPNEQSFQAEIELVTGEWQGLTEVRAYRLIVLASGPRFAPRLPSRPPRNPGPEIIELNQHVLVAARFLGVGVDPEGNRLPVFEPYYIRRID